MAQTPVMPPDRHIPFKKGGWGAAILTTAAAVGAFLAAFWIHTQTYRHPTDLMTAGHCRRIDWCWWMSARHCCLDCGHSYPNQRFRA